MAQLDGLLSRGQPAQGAGGLAIQPMPAQQINPPTQGLLAPQQGLGDLQTSSQQIAPLAQGQQQPQQGLGDLQTSSQQIAPLAQGQQQPQQQPNFQEYIKEELTTAKKALNTVKEPGFSLKTKLDALNSFLGGFGNIFNLGDVVDNITIEQFKEHEASFKQAANKIVRQIEMIEKGQLSIEEFIDTAGDVYDEIASEIENSSGKFLIAEGNPGQIGKTPGTGPIQEFTGDRLTEEQSLEGIKGNNLQLIQPGRQDSPVLKKNDFSHLWS